MRKTAHYKRIEIEGFKSFAKPTTIELDSVGINLIRGTNGVGKSTVIGALMWAEYGLNLTDTIATWADIQPNGYRGTRVKLYRTDGEYDYLIVRHLAFTGTTMGLDGGDKLMIFRKLLTEPEFTQAHMLGDAGNKEAMNSLIEQQLGVSSEVFLNSIVMGQNALNLVDMDNGDKRELFENLFETTFVAEAKAKADARQLELSTKLGGLTEQLNQLVNKASNLEDRKERAEQDYNNAVEDRLQTLEYLGDKLLTLREERAELKEQTSVVQKQLTEYDTSAVKKASAKVNDLTDSIDEEQTLLRKLEANALWEQSKATKLKELNEDLVAVRKTISDLEIDRTATEIRMKAYDKDSIIKLDKALKEAKNAKWDNDDAIESLNTTIAKYVSSHGRGTATLRQQEESLLTIDTKCPTCKGDLPKESLDSAKAEIVKQIQGTKDGLAKLETSIAEFRAQLKALDANKDTLDNKLQKVTDELQTLRSSMEGLSKLEVAIESNKHSLTVAHTQANSIHDRIASLEQETAPKLNTEHTVATLTASIASAQAELQKAKQALEEARLLETEQVRLQGEYNLLHSKLENKQKEITTNAETKKALEEKEISKKAIEEAYSDIAINKADQEAAKVAKAECEAALKKVDWWIKKGFHASGIKAFVFNAMLARLNSYASKYAERLGFRVEFSLDMSKKSRPFQTLVYKEGQVRSYKDLSGGQKKRALVCIGFAMYDLVCDKVNTNIMYLDELTDALDAEGVETLFDLIRVKASNKSVFIICHNDVINAMNTKEMYLALDEDKNTYIVS